MNSESIRAWHVYDEWRTDDRVVFLPEGAEFSQHWRQLGERIAGGSSVWTDAYLCVFALQANATIVTLDRKFPAIGGVVVQFLG